MILPPSELRWAFPAFTLGLLGQKNKFTAFLLCGNWIVTCYNAWMRSFNFCPTSQVFLWMNFFVNCFFSFPGTDSPKAVRKLMALSEPGKTRRHQPKHSVSSLHTNPSPTASPKSLRKGHERSASETAAPVSLSAESSSVATLTTIRKGGSSTTGEFRF